MTLSFNKTHFLVLNHFSNNRVLKNDCHKFPHSFQFSSNYWGLLILRFYDKQKRNVSAHSSKLWVD